MNFRKALNEDADNILALYDSVRNSEYCPWNEYYPAELEIKSDLTAETLYVLESEQKIIGAVSIVPENELDELQWSVSDGTQREFARVAVSPDYQGKGIAAHMIENILDKLKNSGCNAVHILVAKKNLPAVRLYKKLGFDFCGECEMFGGEYFMAEKNF